MTRTQLETIALLLAVAFLGFALGVAVGNERDPRCGQLEQLRDQYRGKALSISERTFKVQATAWYVVNCRGGRRSAEAK